MIRQWEVAGQVARRTWVKTLRRPVVLTFSLVQPLIWLGFFGFLFQRFPLGLNAPATDYFSFLAPGVCAMTVLFGASQSGVSLIRDIQTGFLERMLATPASPGAILAGKVAADALRLLAQALVVLLLALLLGARLSPTLVSLPLGFVLLGLFGFGFSCLSCAIALRARNPETMGTFVHLVNMPILFTSTALVPARQMPGWLEAISRFNPLTLTVESLREALLAGQVPVRADHWLPLVAGVALLFLAAERSLRKHA